MSCTRTSGARARDDLEIYPEPVGWGRAGPRRRGHGDGRAATSQVADRIEEYAALGIEEFILSGYPHLEEAYWFGEGVRPELKRRGLLGGAAGGRACSASFGG